MRVPVLLIAGLAISLVVASCSGAERSEVETVLARAQDAMSKVSFSVTTCDSCDPPTTLEFAPPDSIKLSHDDGHESWRFNLIVDGKRYVSSRGERWVEGASLESAGMPLRDPRVYLQYVVEPRLEGDDTLEGAAHFVISARFDSKRMVDEVYRNVYLKNMDDDEVDDGFDAFLANYEQLIDGLRLRFWIDKETFIVSQLEVDSPPPTQEPGNAGEDPQRGILAFDFETPVNVPDDPLTLTAEEARSFNSKVGAGTRVIREAVDAYIDEIGHQPSAATQEILSEFLSGEWPTNVDTNEPMRHTMDFATGDFCYEPRTDGESYRFAAYGWDGYVDVTGDLCGSTGPGPTMVSLTTDLTVNAVMRAIEAADADALVSLMRASEIPCRVDPRPLGLDVLCPEGLTDGSPVEAFNVTSCESGFVPIARAIENMRGVNANLYIPTSEIYAVYRLPAPSFRSEEMPSYAVLLSYELESLDERQGWILTVHDDGIVGYNSGCVRTPEKLIEDHGWTDPILGPNN